MKKYILLFAILKTLQAYKICTETKCSMKAGHFICPNANLTYFPIAAINAEVLDLSGNYLPQIEQDDLADFRPLTVLTLSNVSLKLIHRDSFRNQKFLEILDLSMNMLKFIYPDTFSDTIIHNLNLSGNIFRRLVSNQFIMPHLRKLDLSNGFLENIHKEVFINSSSLRWVNLSANKLTTIQISEIILSCPRLDRLILNNNNSWLCDCDFYLMSQTPIIAYNSFDLKCEYDSREYVYANNTPFLELSCTDYVNKTFEEIAAKNLEKSNRGDNATNMILNVYGYVMIGFTILIIFCCCCKRKTGNNIVDEEIKPAPVIDKFCKREKNFEQTHTFEKCKVEFHQEDNYDVNKISVSEK